MLDISVSHFHRETTNGIDQFSAKKTWNSHSWSLGFKSTIVNWTCPKPYACKDTLEITFAVPLRPKVLIPPLSNIKMQKISVFLEQTESSQHIFSRRQKYLIQALTIKPEKLNFIVKFILITVSF